MEEISKFVVGVAIVIIVIGLIFSDALSDRAEVHKNDDALYCTFNHRVYRMVEVK